MAEILVTGGAGFIGSAIISGLNESGREDILVADYLGNDLRYRNLVPLRFEDYLEADALLAALYNGDSRMDTIRYVFHLGACSSTTETDVRYLIENNYEYSKRLAVWCLERGARFVYASSAATYGDGSNGMDDQETDLHRFRPLNAYGYSKHLFDLFLAKTGGLSQCAGLKYFNVFGPNELHKGGMMSLVPRALDQIRRTGKVQLFKSEHPDFADGQQQRDFLYIKDAIAMTLHLSFNPDANGLFNVGSGIASTWLDLVTPIFEVVGIDRSIEFVPLPEALRGTYQYFTQANLKRLRESGYHHPVTALRTAVTDYVSHYLLAGRHLGDA